MAWASSAVSAFLSWANSLSSLVTSLGTGPPAGGAARAEPVKSNRESTSAGRMRPSLMGLARQFQIGGRRSPFGIVQQFRDVQDGLMQSLASRKMLQAAYIAADQHIRRGCRNIAQFAGAQLGRQLRLQDGIGTGGAAAKVRFQEGRDNETRRFQQRFAHAIQLQAVLQRAG